MTQIDLITTDQVLTVVQRPTIASGDQNSVNVQVEFDAFWDSYAKSVVFFTDKNPTVYEAVLTDSICTIPREVLSESGRLFIGVRGVNGNKIKTSTLVRYKIVEGAPAGTGTLVPPSSTVYQQLLSQLQLVIDKLEVERQRINVIASLPEGSTTADAELADIRVGYDGTTYDNAGEAVRGQARQANDRLDALAAAHTRDFGSVAPPVVLTKAGSQITVSDASDQLLQGLTIYGKTTQDGDPTPEAPVELVSVGTGGTIETKITGKNITPDMVYSSFGKDYASLVICNDTSAVKKGELYTISVTLTATADTTAYWNSASKLFANETIQVSAGANRYSRTFTALADGEIGVERILVSKSATGDGVVITPADCQVELGAAATGYDATPSQSLTVTTPNGLPGVPMARMGVHPNSYTDSDGNCWVSDEVDLARGVYVQRVGTVTSADMLRGLVALNQESDNYNQYTVNSVLGSVVPGVSDSASTASPYKALCNCLPLGGQVNANTSKDAFWIYSLSVIVLVLNKTDFPDVESVETWLANNEVEIQYILADPIETALTAEELATFAALHTNKPDTTIRNDAVTHMTVEYVADTKIYIDNKSKSATVITGAAARIGEVTLLATGWVGATSPYSQVVAIEGITEYSQVDLKPSVEQLAIFHNKDLAFVTENENGVVTVYAIGEKPENDYTIQANILEVSL